MVRVITFPALKDNLCYLITREGAREAIAVDPAEPQAVRAALSAHGLTLSLILNTHHHHDHVGGNAELAHEFACPVYCSQVDLERGRVPSAMRGLRDGEVFTWSSGASRIEFEVLAIPGHTDGQIAYHIRESNDLFSGDTVFAMGCGRLFEGTPEQMLSSLKRIAALPTNTKIHYGHEYTVRNSEFARQFEPSNAQIKARADRAREALTPTQDSSTASLSRATSLAPVGAHPLSPVGTLADELATNPFFRSSSTEIRQTLAKLDGHAYDSDLAVFTRLRELRNSF